MTEHPLFMLALELALNAHRNQLDKGGAPYILHPLRVMFRCQDATTRLVALLHDVVEDSEMTLDGLRQHGFDDEVVCAVAVLSRQATENYDEFIRRIAPQPVAKAVKIADLQDNLDISRLPPVLTLQDKERLAKYERALEYLSGN